MYDTWEEYDEACDTLRQQHENKVSELIEKIRVMSDRDLVDLIGDVLTNLYNDDIGWRANGLYKLVLSDEVFIESLKAELLDRFNGQ